MGVVFWRTIHGGTESNYLHTTYFSGSQLGAILPNKGYLVMFGDIFGCHI